MKKLKNRSHSAVIGRKLEVPKVGSLLSKVTPGAMRENTAIVETVIALSNEEQMRLARVLSKLVGHDVNIEQKMNTDLIAGIRVQMADWIVDTSFRGQLDQMSSFLL